MVGEEPVWKLDLAARVAVAEDRLDRVQMDVKTIADKLDEAVRDIRQDIGCFFCYYFRGSHRQSVVLLSVCAE